MQARHDTRELVSSRGTFVAVLLAACLVGCTTTEGLATARAANEFHCPENRVVLSARPELSEGTYDVDACGHHARYTCIVDYGDSFVPSVQACTREPRGDEPTSKGSQ